MNIIKFNSSKDSQQTRTNSGGGGTSGGTSSSSYNQQEIRIESLWQRGNAQGSLVPQGSYNITEGVNSVAIGTETQTTNEGELAIGTFNLSTPDETIFSIGDGLGNDQRHNLFSVDDDGDTYIDGTLTVNNNIIGKGELSVPTLNATDGNITNLESDTINVNNLNATDIDTQNLDVSVSAYINELLSHEISTEYLTVTKSAHFFELIIDQIKATKGQVIITAGNATIDLVEPISNGYRCYFRATDGDRQIYNTFDVDDQIICQTFNVAEGISYNVSNKFYWRLCTGISNGVVTKTIDGLETDCWYVDLSDIDKDNRSSIPEAGDEIVQLGNRNDVTRQAAIIISAYNNTYLDSEIKAPSIVQYDGINEYNLSRHRLNVISKTFNKFKGNFSTTTGDDIEDLINNIGQGTTMYIHTAYSNSADGQLNFSKTYFDGAKYIGMCSNFSSTDTNLTYSDYQWMRLKGEDGQDGQNGQDGQDGQDGQNGQDGQDAYSYKLLPVQETAMVSVEDKLGISFVYQLVKIEGITVTPVNPYSSNFIMRFKSDINSQYTSFSETTTAFIYNNAGYMFDYHDSSSKPTYFTIELFDGDLPDVVETRIVNVTFDAGATLTIKDDIMTYVQNVEGDMSSFKQTANSIMSSLSDRLGTAESNITQTQNSISSEVIARQQGDIKYLPLVTPIYDSSFSVVTEYLTDPIRYGSDDIYTTPTFIEKGTYKFRIFSTISSVSTLTSWFVVCSYHNKYPSDISVYDTISSSITQGGTLKCRDNTTLYEYNGEVTITESGYYNINFWASDEYIHIPDDSDELGITYSRIQQTNNRITTEVGNLNGQISNIDQKADSIELSITNGLTNTGINISNNTITLNADKTTINGEMELNQSSNDGFKLNATDSNGNERNLYVTAGLIDDAAVWSNKAAGIANAITKLGSNGFEFISTKGGTFPGNKAYIGDNLISFVNGTYKLELRDDGIYYVLPNGSSDTITKRNGHEFIKVLTSSNGTRYYATNDKDIDLYMCQYANQIIVLSNPDVSWNGKKITIKNQSSGTIYICGNESSNNMVPVMKTGAQRNTKTISPYYDTYKYIHLEAGCTITLVYENIAGTNRSLWWEISSDGYYTDHAAAWGTTNTTS